jgi:hypothetical protein
MKYQVVKGCVVKGEAHQPGSVVELDGNLARDLMGIGRVVPLDESEPVNRSVGLEASSEEPVKRRGRPKKVVEEEPEEAPEE